MGYIHFFDDWQLISYVNLERRQGRPKYVPEATLEDELTEGTWNFPLVTWDKDKGLYVGLYGGAVDFQGNHRIKVPEGIDKNLIPRTQILCYAQSRDGIHWERPDVREFVNLDGPVHANNQVFGFNQPVEGGPPFYDIYEQDSSKRYKFLINLGEKGYRALAVSPDGIRWRVEKEYPFLKATDTPSAIFYHPERKIYVLSVRKSCGDRRIFFIETEDWEKFSEPRLVMHPDTEDQPLIGLYGMPVVRYENIFIGLLWKIYCDPLSFALPNGPIDCELTYSYDGTVFNRTTHKPFIERNELGEHGGGCVYVGSMLVDEDNRIRFYSAGSKAEHFQNQTLKDAAIMLHRLRLDGFFYFATHAGKGRLRTKAMRITGDEIKINARSPFGGIRVQVIDEKGDIIPGYSFDDCIPLRTDELFWQPVWKGGKTISGVKSNKRRQLDIEIITGEIYAIRGDFEMLETLWEKD